MKEEDKKLLLIDLSARLPYGVKASYRVGEEKCEHIGVVYRIDLETFPKNPIYIGDYILPIEFIKPYLFPMSSMTEEQEVEFDNIECDYFDNIYGTVYSTELNWLNKNHFDYHNLIEKGLALDATNLNIY